MALTAHYRWRRANFVLLALIILVNSYIIATPFLPSLLYWAHHRDTAKSTPTVAAAIEQTKKTSSPNVFQADAAHDGIIIPRIDLNTPLVEGPMSNSFNLLNQGAWRLPLASSPDKGGNTVIAGHRFSYTGPRGIFYFLDKLQVGDQIGLWYHGQLYTYVVESSATHPATDVYVQQPTSGTRLTLYTCTPLWNPTNRLVVVAKPLTTEHTP
jgi:sortase A